MSLIDNNLLYTAIENQNFGECHRLLEARADVNARDNYGWTPLHCAIKKQWSAGYHLLTEMGADVNATGAHDVAFITHKARRKILGILGQTIPEGMPSGWSPVQIAIRDKRPEAVRFLLEHGAKLSTEDKSVLSSLLPSALEQNYFETVRCLLENGAIVTERDKKRLGDLLRTVIDSGSLEKAIFLLEHGAPPISDGLTIAVRTNNPELIRGLIRTGHWTKELHRFRQTFLEAKYNGFHEIGCCLVKHGMDLATVFEMAIGIGSVEMVRCLVDEEVPQPVLDEGLKLAVRIKLFDIARELIDAGAKCDDKIEEAIESYCVSNGGCSTFASVFQLKRPKLNVPEVFHNKKFQTLVGVDFKSLKKPIALLNIGAYEQMGPDYGVITKYLSPSFLLRIEKMALHFTVIRVIINDPFELVSIIKKIKRAVPDLPINYWALIGHGNENAVGLGDGLLFRSTHTSIMQELSELIDSLGVFAFWGCSNAKGDSNLVREFSKVAFRQLVLGSPNDTCFSIPVRMRFRSSPNPLLLTVFGDSCNSPYNLHMRVYKNGEEIVDGISPRGRI